MPPLPTVAALAEALAGPLDAARYAREGDPAGVWIASDRPIQRLGLRLDAGRVPYAWAGSLDALLIHRPFGLWPARLPEGLGVLAAHRALDERLSVGYNPALVRALGFAPISDSDPDEEAAGAPLHRGGLPVGLVARAEAPLDWDAFADRLRTQFGGWEAVRGAPPEGVGTVALVGAMTPALVAEASARGAAVYVTGQLRPAAFDAARAAGLCVVAVGQDRAEAWGLRHLGRLLRERWPALELVESDLPGLA